jgi:hypothetical protein
MRSALALLLACSAAAETRVESFGPLVSHAAALPMEGPFASRSLELPEPRLLRAARVFVAGEDGRPLADQSALCHVTLAGRDPSKGHHGAEQLLTLDGTTPALSWPGGWGLPLAAGRRYQLTAMTHGPASERPRWLRVELELAEPGTARPLAVAQTGISAAQADEPPATGPHDWKLPRGRRRYAAPASFEKDLRVRLATAHLHRGAVALTLSDAAGRELLAWRASGASASAPSWAPKGGLRLKAGEGYELAVEYDNPDGEERTAMASLYLFYEDGPPR